MRRHGSGLWRRLRDKRSGSKVSVGPERAIARTLGYSGVMTHTFGQPTVLEPRGSIWSLFGFYVSGSGVKFPGSRWAARTSAALITTAAHVTLTQYARPPSITSLHPADPSPRGISPPIAFRLASCTFGLYICSRRDFIPVSRLAAASARCPTFLGNQNVSTTTVRSGLCGSGDNMFDYVFVLFCSSSASSRSAGLHSSRANYVRLQKWFRVYVRFGLATTMLSYGMAKAIPLQMSAPSLTRLLEPYGNFSPMGVLWASIGASFSYERLVGCMELLAAALLFIPQTVVLGGVVSLIDSIQIFSLNMTYDVPVKLFSFHLILLSIVLAGPDIRRLLNVMVFNKTALPSPTAAGRRRR